ncbi:hypothetical protein [Paenibacillus qinlingensis]|uniref:hypothetical protein n=1 Tax=Paenibacillus qinlingensis TaxID=1837343 RepID=UPI00156426D5|nr:hypothetical protein [Paenibacillus qinlingensis]NQX63763.1 hypothetical protein [Paenibacillus qinlingensis]
MLTILNHVHIKQLLESSILPAASLHYIITEFETLKAMLHHDDCMPFSFSLDAHGYLLVLLEPRDNFHCLPIANPRSSQIDLLESNPEYVELTTLPDEISMYRICFMFDNESYLFMYILNDSLDMKLVQWLAERAGLSSAEELQ